MKFTDEELAHFGILGMKWGVRKATSSSASSSENKLIKDRKNAFHNKIVDVEVAADKHMSSKAKTSVDDINSAFEKGDMSTGVKLLRKYTAETIKLGNEYLDTHKSSIPKGAKLKYEDKAGNYNANTYLPNPTVWYNGQKVDFQWTLKPSEADRVFLQEPNDSAKHSNTDDDILAHFGVKGMQWGVRKARSSSGKSRKVTRSDDYKESRSLKSKAGKSAKALSNSELEKLNKRLQLEQTYSQLTKNRSKMKKGMTVVNDILALNNTASLLLKAASPIGKIIKKAAGG